MVICSWTIEPAVAFLFSFLHVFILWSLHAITRILENPFGQDVDDLDIGHMQRVMNCRLLQLLHPDALHRPTCSQEAVQNYARLLQQGAHRDSFRTVWHELDNALPHQNVRGRAEHTSLPSPPAREQVQAGDISGSETPISMGPIDAEEKTVEATALFWHAPPPVAPAPLPEPMQFGVDISGHDSIMDDYGRAMQVCERTRLGYSGFSFMGKSESRGTGRCRPTSLPALLPMQRRCQCV